jgi:hypothetical protein
VGIADLRQAAEHYPAREALKLWIQDAPRIRPGTRIPGWKDVIREQDYEPHRPRARLGTAELTGGAAPRSLPFGAQCPRMRATISSETGFGTAA